MVVNLGVKDVGDFKFQFITDNDWQGKGLNVIGDWIQSCQFTHGDVEKWVYSAETVWKS